MERYVLAGYSITEISNKIEAVRVLTQDEFNIIKGAIKSLGDFDKRQSLYHIFLNESKDLITFYEETTNQLNQDQFSEEIVNNIVEGINQRLKIYLSSFLSFIDCWNKRLDPLASVKEGEFNLYKFFKERTNFHFDNSFSYGFFCELRNYVQHRVSPPVVIELQVLPQLQQKKCLFF